MEKPPVRVGIAVFVFKNGKIVMLKRKGSHGAGSWSIPGGHLEFNESFEETARRETKEETGLDISDIRFCAVTNDFFKEDNKHYVTVWMAAKHASGTETIIEPHKCTEIGWFDFDHLPSPLFLPWNQLLKSDFIEDIKKLSKQ